MLVSDKRQYIIVPGMDNRGKRGKYDSFILKSLQSCFVFKIAFWS